MNTKMKLTIVYDNEVYIPHSDLKPDWGFSCLLETRQNTVLFDTGAKGSILLHNMDQLSIDPGKIDTIIISHEHWDHKGGLPALAEHISKCDLYELTDDCPFPSLRLHHPKKPLSITEKIWTTGRLEGVMDEQSLILQGEKGWCVLVGCSHPGVETILHAAAQRGDITGLVGGLHGFDNFSLLEPLSYVCPCHCTRYKKKIETLYPSTYLLGGVGRIINI